MAGEFIDRGQQTLVFANSRLATEVLLTYLKQDCETKPMSGDAVRGYRGGYLPRERREIERQLRDGDIRAVVATNALELGIDIGSLDAVVLAGYPGTIASTLQRAGRAGRRQTSSIAVLVASSAPVDQYIVEHPEYFFNRSPEHALHQPRQPRDLAQPPALRGFRAARPRRREVRARTIRRACAASSKRSGVAAPVGRRVALDIGHLSGRRRQPALGHQRQLRRRRYHGRAQGDRRRLVSRPP